MNPFRCLALLFFVACCCCSSNPTSIERYREANAQLRPPEPTEKRVVFLGDSITDCWPLEAYFPGEPFVNRGIGGETTFEMLARFRQDVIELRPKVVVILAGTNDIGSQAPEDSLSQVKANFESMAELARANGIEVVLSSVLPVHDYNPAHHVLFSARPVEKIRELNRWLHDYSRSHHLVYLDYFNAMIDDAGFLRRELADDGLHPNAAGYAIMASIARTGLAARPESG